MLEPRKKKKNKNTGAGWCNGQIRRQCGYLPRVDGKKVGARFYLGTDKKEAEIRLARLRLEWERVKSVGCEVWPQQVIDDLVKDGIINQINDHYKRTSDLADEVLQGKDLTPFQDPKTGKVLPEFAPKITEIMVQTIIKKDDVQNRFAQKFEEGMMKDPIATYERVSKIFGWGSAQAVNQIQVITNPISFDESEKRTNIIDVIDDTEANELSQDSDY